MKEESGMENAIPAGPEAEVAVEPSARSPWPSPPISAS
jgi:hypothetical protein